MTRSIQHPIGKYVLSLAIAASLTLAHAQQRGAPPDGRPPRIDFASALALDPTTAQAVGQVLHEQHEKHRTLGLDAETVRSRHEAIRQETDEKLAKLLTAGQLEKLHQLLPKPPGGDRHPPE